MLIDSSGLKIYGEGEWKVRVHGYSRRRQWMKLHLAVDEANQLIINALLTDYHTDDAKQLDTLLNGCGKKNGNLYKVAADAAYDRHQSYETIERYGAIPVISPNINPRHSPKSLETLRAHKPRDTIRYLQETIGLKEWKIEQNYHRRSLVETTFYRFKQLLGSTLNARHFASQCTEALLKCHLLNALLLVRG